jgi:hypothetical protein
MAVGQRGSGAAVLRGSMLVADCQPLTADSYRSTALRTQHD